MQRTFLGWERPVLHAAADTLIGESGDQGPVDLSRHLVVVPGGRAGRRLVELLLDRAERQERPLRPPRIVEVGGMPEALFHPARPAPDPIPDHLAWAQALVETGDAVLRQVFPVPGEEEESDRAWLDEAAVLSRLHASVGAASHDFSDVARICRRTSMEGGFNDEGRWSALSIVQERYRAILRRHGWQDRESARREALESDRIAAPGEVWVIGAPDLPPVHRAFLAAAARGRRIHILVAAPAALADRFDEMGCVDPDGWRSELAEIPDAQVRVVSGPNEQASVVMEHLTLVAAGRSPDDISIGVPDGSLVPCLVERLGEAGVGARYAGGLALERTSEFQLLEGVITFLRARDFNAFSALLRHPEIERRIRRELEPTLGPLVSLVDRYRALHLPARLERKGPLPSGGEWVRETWEPQVREVRDALDRVMGPLVGLRPLSRWADPVADFLVDLLGDRPVDRHDEVDREIFELLRSVGLALDGLDRIPPALDRSVPGHVALRLILDELRGGVVPPAAGEAAVELLGWLELALDDAPVLIVTGVNEPHLPDSVTADPFLPHGLRRALGMLDNDGRWARDLLHLKTLLATRPETLLVAGRRDGEGNPLLPSRLLLAEEPATVASRILAFLGAIGAERPDDPSTTGAETPDDPSTTEAEVSAGSVSTTGAEIPGSPLITGATGRSEGSSFRLPPDPELSDPEPPDRIGVTAFRTLLADPYRYALEHVLHLRSEDDRDREMDGAGFGGLAHAVLERFGRSQVAGSADPEEITAAVMALMAAEAEARFGSHPLPAVRLQLEQLRARLRGFASWQTAWRRTGWSIRAVEAVSAGEGVPFKVDGEIIHLRGKVDRIDFHEPTGAWVVLDYKTGENAVPPDKAHRAGRGADRRWIDLQLPLYLRIAPFLVDRAGAAVIPPGDTGRIRAGYVSLPRDATKIGAQLADWTDEEIAEATDVAREAIRILRRNRFIHDPSRVRLHRGDPLAAVLGAGVMRLTEDDEDEDAE